MLGKKRVCFNNVGKKKTKFDAIERKISIVNVADEVNKFSFFSLTIKAELNQSIKNRSVFQTSEIYYCNAFFSSTTMMIISLFSTLSKCSLYSISTKIYEIYYSFNLSFSLLFFFIFNKIQFYFFLFI